MLVLLSNALKTGCGEPLILEPNAKVFNPTTCCSIQVGCDMSREPTPNGPQRELHSSLLRPI